MSKAKKLKFILVFVLLFFPFFSFAQLRGGDVVLTISPENPKAGEQVTATLTSYATNLNVSFISWLTNDELITEGVGKRFFSFNVGDLNTDLVLSARINTTSGDSILKTLTITPTEVDLLWEAVDSYVPPFYKGKALPLQEATIKVVAIPNVYTLGSKVNPQNLSYTWRRDGSVAQESSGWGKNYYIFKNSYLEKENEVEVEATDILSKVKPFGVTTLKIYQPKIVFYKKEADFGLDLKRAVIDNYDLPKEGATLVAVPYFFSPKNTNKEDLKVEWEIDGEKISSPAIKNELSLRGEEGGSGTSAVRVLFNNTKTLFQELEANLNVNF